jgi:hypothetical protein
MRGAAASTPGVRSTTSSSFWSNATPPAAVISSVALPVTVANICWYDSRVVAVPMSIATAAATPMTMLKSVRIVRPGRCCKARIV